MPRYFFHVVEGTHIIFDDEGSDLLDLDAVQKEAVQSARGYCERRSFREESRRPHHVGPR